MHHAHTSDDRWLRGLPAPTKINYFYGMLLSEELLRKEQRYSDGKRWLLNRFGLGKGVLAGLDFEIVPVGRPGQSTRHVCVLPGAAVDGYGREIVVPGGPKDGTSDEVSSYELCVVTGDHETRVSEDGDGFTFLAALAGKDVGKPTEVKKEIGDSVKLELQIAYDQRPTDPVRALAGHCSDECKPSTIREQFRIRVRRLGTQLHEQKLPAAVNEELVRRWEKGEELNFGWITGNLPTVFPQEPNETIRHRNEAQKVGLAPPAFPDKEDYEELPWVTLGVIELKVVWEGPAETPKPKSLAFEKRGRYYRQLFGNDALSRLVFALADRVDEAARVRVLTYPTDSGEGQSGRVYRTLARPLKVKVIDSHGNVPKNLASAKVRFEVLTPDGGKLSTTKFDDTKPYATDPTPAGKWVEVGIDAATGLAESVYWRLSKTPGSHTVSARIIPAEKPVGGLAAVAAVPAAAATFDAAFHPGSQIVFYATAVPTAPKIIGMHLHDWHTPVKDGCIDWKKGSAKLRIVFSREMKDDAIKEPEKWLRVWRMYSGSCDPERPEDVKGPEPQKPQFYKLGWVGNTKDSRGAWYAEYRLPGLLENLHDHFTLRMLVALRPPGDLTSLELDSGDPLYPNRQQLDADFDGSFLMLADRKELWDTDKLTGSPSDQEKWERFEPRERSLPSGNGTEGADFPNEFHKTFEFRLPRCR